MRLFAKITSAVSALAMLAGMAVVPASADTAVREVKLELTEANVVGRYSKEGTAMSTPDNTAALFDGATDGIVEFGTQQFLYIDLGEPTAISKLVLKTDETGMSIRKSAYGAAMAAVTNELPNAANPRDTVLDAARNNDRAVNGVEVISMSEPVEVQGSDYETEGAGTFYPEKVVGPVTPDGKDTYPAAEDGKYRYVVLYNWSAGGRFTELEVYTQEEYSTVTVYDKLAEINVIDCINENGGKQAIDTGREVAYTTADNSVWYLGQYDLSEIAKVEMRLGLVADSDGNIPQVKLAYMPVNEGEEINEAYINTNNGTIRSAGKLIATAEGVTQPEGDEDNGHKYEGALYTVTADGVTVDADSYNGTATVGGNSQGLSKSDETVNLFVYATANKRRAAIDTVTLYSSREIEDREYTITAPDVEGASKTITVNGEEAVTARAGNTVAVTYTAEDGKYIKSDGIFTVSADGKTAVYTVDAVTEDIVIPAPDVAEYRQGEAVVYNATEVLNADDDGDGTTGDIRNPSTKTIDGASYEVVETFARVEELEGGTTQAHTTYAVYKLGELSALDKVNVVSKLSISNGDLAAVGLYMTENEVSSVYGEDAAEVLAGTALTPIGVLSSRNGTATDEGKSWGILSSDLYDTVSSGKMTTVTFPEFTAESDGYLYLITGVANKDSDGPQTQRLIMHYQTEVTKEYLAGTYTLNAEGASELTVNGEPAENGAAVRTGDVVTASYTAPEGYCFTAADDLALSDNNTAAVKTVVISDAASANITAPEAAEVVAGIGDMLYSSLRSALAASSDGDTVTLKTNIYEARRADAVGGTVTIDGAGCSVDFGLYVNEDGVRSSGILAGDGNLIIKNITLNQTNADFPAIDYKGGKSVTLENVTVNGDIYSSSGTNNKLGISGSEINGSVYTRNYRDSADKNTCALITAENSQISEIGIYLNPETNTAKTDVLTLSGCTVGKLTVINAKAGDVVINGTSDIEQIVFLNNDGSVNESLSLTESGGSMIASDGSAPYAEIAEDGTITLINCEGLEVLVASAVKADEVISSIDAETVSVEGASYVSAVKADGEVYVWNMTDGSAMVPLTIIR